MPRSVIVYVCLTNDCDVLDLSSWCGDVMMGDSTIVISDSRILL